MLKVGESLSEMPAMGTANVMGRRTFGRASEVSYIEGTLKIEHVAHGFPQISQQKPVRRFIQEISLE